jgi:pimeloyl-[acyl-carrier protein] methyl ester esterase
MMELHSETHGSGEPLVLWHGWGMNLRVFDPLVARLAQNFRVTSFDLPGHGRSAWPADGDLDDALPELVSRLPPGCTLAGWSMGGLLALRAAQLAPGRIRALILLHSTPKFVADASWPHGVAGSVLQQFAKSLQAAPDKTVADFIEMQVRGSRDAADVLTQLRDALRRHGAARPSALAAGLRLLQRTDLRALAARLRVPTLIVAGQYDRVTPPAASRALCALMSDARLEELPRAGHASFIAHTEPVAALCADWLRALHAVRAQA